jgi:hypothetical protein
MKEYKVIRSVSNYTPITLDSEFPWLYLDGQGNDDHNFLSIAAELVGLVMEVDGPVANSGQKIVYLSDLHWNRARDHEVQIDGYIVEVNGNDIYITADEFLLVIEEVCDGNGHPDFYSPDGADWGIAVGVSTRFDNPPHDEIMFALESFHGWAADQIDLLSKRA